MPSDSADEGIAKTMRWSFRLGRVAGIDLYVHVTFFLLIFWVALAQWAESRSIASTVVGIAFILTLFGCVVLHELGHALMARTYNIATRDITLLPIGGVAHLERLPDRPIQEFWVAIAGPLVNVVIGAALFTGIVLWDRLLPMSDLSLVQGSFVQRLMWVNLFLVAFNMLPAFPMDGGRILRAFLASRMPYQRATHIAATVGQGMALLFGFLGLFGYPMLLFIALFVWIGAAQESSAADLRAGLAGVPVADAMITQFRALAPTDSLDQAVELILAGSQHDFPVVDNGQVLGLLTRSDLMVALARLDRTTRVQDVMKRKIPLLHSDSLVLDALPQLQSGEFQTLPVLRDNRLAGLLTSENIGELLMIRSALKSRL